MSAQTLLIELSYFAASILFVLGLRGLSHPDTARRGMFMAEFGMLLAVIGTLLHHDIVSYEWILVGLLVGLDDRRRDGPLGPDDGDAAADRALARLRRPRGGPRRRLGVPPPRRAPRDVQGHGPRVRGPPRRDHVHGQPHRLREAPGAREGRADRLPRPERPEPDALRERRRRLRHARPDAGNTRGSFTSCAHSRSSSESSSSCRSGPRTCPS